MLKDGRLLAWLYHQSISKLSLRIFSRLFNIWPHSFILSLIHCDFYWISEKWFINLVHLVSIFIDIRDRDWSNFKQELDQSFPIFIYFFSFFVKTFFPKIQIFIAQNFFWALCMVFKITNSFLYPPQYERVVNFIKI